jgi:hypothetical protein
MKLSKTFENEIKKVANGDGSRDYMFAFIDELKKISAALSNRYEFAGAMEKYGRAKVSVCIAATILRSTYRHESGPIGWAMAVMDTWTNKCGRSVSEAIINIYPAVLEDLSRGMRKLTAE